LLKKTKEGYEAFLTRRQTEAVLFFHLFHRVRSSAKASELGKFLLDSL